MRLFGFIFRFENNEQWKLKTRERAMSGSEDEFSDELDEFEESAADEKGHQHYLVTMDWKKSYSLFSFFSQHRNIKMDPLMKPMRYHKIYLLLKVMMEEVQAK